MAYTLPDGTEIYEWPWAPPDTVQPGVVETSEGLMTPEQIEVAIMTYVPGIEEDCVVPVTGAVAVVPDIVVPIVTDLDFETGLGVIAMGSDEIWLPHERETVEMYVTDGYYMPEYNPAVGQVAAPGVVTALYALLAVIIGMVIEYGMDFVQDWLSDRITTTASNEGFDPEKAIYYGRRLVGYTSRDGSVRRAPMSGRYGVYGMEIREG